MSDEDLSNFSLIELFRVEAEGQIALLTRHLLALEDAAPDAAALEAMMRAAHSLKGAARIVGLDAAVRVAHALEDCFVAAQGGSLTLDREATDALLQGVDWLTQISRLEEAQVEGWTRQRESALAVFVATLAALGGVPPSSESSFAEPDFIAIPSQSDDVNQSLTMGLGHEALDGDAGGAGGGERGLA